MGFDILLLWDRLLGKWETKSGLGIGLILLFFLYFFVLNYFDIESFMIPILKYLVLPLILALFVFIFWVSTTNRFFLKFSNKIYTGVIVILDDDRDRLVVNKIVGKVINQINKSAEFQDGIQLKLLPSNFCVHESEINRYHNNFYFMYDLIIRVFVESGNYESIEKIIVERFSVTFTRKSPTWKKRILYNTIDLTQDMNLLVGARNWQYLISNSGIDKKKYLANFHNIIIYYVVFYAIYSDRYEDALNILARVFEPNNTIVKISRKEENSVTLELQPFNLAEARLSTILVDLFFDSAIKSYHQKDIPKAISRLEQLEKLVKVHNQKFDLFINMARWNYELGNVDKAVNYTEQAKMIDPKAIQIYLNLGFFAILQNNVTDFCINFKKLFEMRNNPVINWVDVIDFQLKEQEKMPAKLPFFNFSISFIEYIFIDESNKSKFKNIVADYKETDEYACIFKLGLHVLSQPYLKMETNHHLNKKKSGNKKKRRKR
ncbi:MAG: hypothetical protein RIB64_16480 [Arenibacter algicola]